MAASRQDRVARLAEETAAALVLGIPVQHVSLEEGVVYGSTAEVDVVAPSRSQASIRFREIARAVEDIEGVKVFPGYRRVVVGGLTINVRSDG